MSTVGTTAVARPRGGLRKWALTLVVAALVLLGFYLWFALNWAYSTGERAGLLQKFSERGWVCKTYEGELALYVVAGVQPEIWRFSVRDPEVAARLHDYVGRRVRLHYEQRPPLPTTCFGDTPYHVDRIDSMPDLPPAAGAPVAPPP
jgi:hypothetical protein